MRPDMGSLMKQAQRMQAELARVQEEIANERIEVSVGGGAVKAVMTGALVLESLDIDPGAMDPDDVGMLEDLVVAAVNEALRQAQEAAAKRMEAVTGGLKIPGLR
ncbi:YbaB/EbfC family nucleoid-associated protein [Coriobacteriia bacterium Es71-Z0120]|uniref:YbaB/EbfC family nucleoid-associated protein n=1 Tax=Parvivirga hydrogeniphila TaxID=2939460 RepID=UPI002260E426|nr:YbaB/EbfC family nucleoid-associated protein [Parvivirga hydrogeniphila]MCL4078325.1 YbaB/EbfC family nucleoid-associated protein [Parvivirga hydrogeniphila]